MNLKMPQLKFVRPVMTGAVGLLAAVFPAAAQPTNGTDFASFQIIAQRNIFDPNRVPRTHYASASTARAADSFSFAGTMSYARGNFAFFDGTSPDLRKVLELNGDIAGFKLTALTPKSATLSSGTNEMVLPVGTQVRRDDDGHWKVTTEPIAYGSAGQHRGRSATAATTANNPSADNANPTDSGTDTHPPETAAPAGGGANDALTRLMQQRAQEEQQLGAGQ